MSNEKPPSRTADQFVVRFPDGMRDRIADEAKKNNRSMNAEIVARLQASLAKPVDLSGAPIPMYDQEKEMRYTASLVARVNLEALRSQVMALESQAIDLEYKSMELKLRSQEQKLANAADWDAPLAHAKVMESKMKQLDEQVATLRKYIREIEATEKEARKNEAWPAASAKKPPDFST